MSKSDVELLKTQQLEESPAGTPVLVGVLLLAIAVGSVALVLANSAGL